MTNRSEPENEPETTEGTADDTADAETLGYAAAMHELETILRELEQPDVDIDVVADRVERAATLVALCRGRLEHARLRVTEIVADLESS